MFDPNFHSPQATIAGGGVIPHIHKSLINKVGKDGKVSPMQQLILLEPQSPTPGLRTDVPNSPVQILPPL